MLSLLLSFKYLLRTKIVILSVLAVALSCALLICISSLFTGFIGALENAASDHLGDVLLQPYPGAKITYSEKLIERLTSLEEVQAASPVVSTQGLLLLGKGDVRKVTVWGIDPKTQATVSNIKDSLISQSALESPPKFAPAGDKNEQNKIYGYIGIGVIASPDPITDLYDMDRAKSLIGSKAVLMSGVMDERSPEQSSGRAKEIRRVNIAFEICDIAFSGVDQFDSESIYLPIEELSNRLYPELKGKGIVADSVQIKLKEGCDKQAAIIAISQLWREFAADKLDWNEAIISYTNIRLTSDITANMIAEYTKQMDILMLIFGIVSSGVILLVCCIFYMLVLTRQKDIAIMRSCGAPRSCIAAIFIQFGLVVGVIGSAMGLWVGRFFTVNINEIERQLSLVFGLNVWKSSVYMFSKIPNQVDWSLAMKIVLTAIIAAVLGSIIPAFIAAAIKPVKILRYE